MLRNIGEKVFLNKYFLLIIDKVTTLLLICGLLFMLWMPRFTESNDSQASAASANLNKMLSLKDVLLSNFNAISNSSLQHCTDADCVRNYVEEYFDTHNLRHARQQFVQHSSSKRENIIGVYHAQRSNNFECQLITFDINPINRKISVPFALSFIEFFEHPKINYISRNVLFLGYDSRGADYGYSVQKFLEDYESPDTTIPKCGTLRQGINIDLDFNFQTLFLKTTGFDGRVPYFDFYWIQNKLFTDEFGESGYKSSEAPVQLPIKIGNFLERKLEEVGRILGFRVPDQFFRNLKSLIHVLGVGIYGEIHDGHSQMLLHSIQSATIAGRKDENAGSTTNPSKIYSQKLLSLFNVVEAGLRSNFAYDSQFNEGTTLYIPVRKNQQIGIKMIALAAIAVLVPVGIQVVSIFFKSKLLKNPGSSTPIYANHFMGFIHIFIVLALPALAQKITDLIDGSDKQAMYCSASGNPNNSSQKANKFFLILLSLIFFSRLALKFIADQIIVKRILKIKSYRGDATGNIQAMSGLILLVLIGIVYLFQNFALCFFTLITLTPMLSFGRPIFRSGLIKSFVTLALTGCTFYLLWLTGIDFIEEAKNVVIVSQCIPRHSILFYAGCLFNLLFGYFNLILF